MITYSLVCGDCIGDRLETGPYIMGRCSACGGTKLCSYVGAPEEGRETMFNKWDEVYHISLDVKPHTASKLIGAVMMRPEERVGLFNAMLHKIDTDWPFKDNMALRWGKVCEQCHGGTYNNPVIDLGDIKRLGDQLAINVRIQSYKKAKKCQR